MKNMAPWGRACCLCLALLNAPLARSVEVLHITSGLTPPVSSYFKKIFDVINQRYPRYHINFEELSAERALILADRGINTGECCRIPSVILKDYPNLVVVPYKLYSLKWVAFSGTQINIRKWSDLKPYNTVTINGWKLAEKELGKLKPASLEIVRTPRIMMDMLHNDRAEVGVMGYLSGLQAMRGIPNHESMYISKPLAVSPLYLLINKKYAYLVPDLKMIFQSLDKDGTLDRLYQETANELFYTHRKLPRL